MPAETYLGADIERHGVRIAAVDESGAAISHADLAAQADALGREIGAERRLILLEGDNSIDWLVAYVAALRGRHPVLIAPNGNAAAWDALAAQFDPAMMMRAADGYRPAPTGSTGPPVHDELAVMLSTSGSTGSTKCVRLSRGNILANATSIAEYLAIGADERGAVNLPTHYSYGLSIVNSHLAAGATMLLTRGSVIDKGFWQFLAEQGATSFAGVPHVYDLLQRMDLASVAPPSLRYFTQAGGRLPPETGRRFATLAGERGWRFFIMYGQTEATARIAYVPPALAAEHSDAIGVAIPGGRLELVADDGRAVEADGEQGELIYHGANVMMGYAAAPDDLAAPPGPSRLATGDLAERTADGLFRITGRKSRFIKVLGNRVALDEVEAVLERAGLPAIATGVDDRLIVATRQADAVPTIAALLEERLALPGGYIAVLPVEEYPLLATGKLDYAALRALATPDAAPPSAGVMAAFVGVFGDAARDEDQSFASLGGDSLNYVLVTMTLERAIPALPADWETMTIAALGALARERSGGWLTTIESNVALRAAGITAVVVGHATSDGYGGGANLLMLLVGVNLLRFRGPAMLAGRVWGNVWAYLQKLIVPYLLLNGAYMLWKHDVVASGLMMVSNFEGPRVSPSLFPQWFVQVTVQCTLVLAVLLSVGPLRTAIARRPFATLLMLFAASVAARAIGMALWDTFALYNRVPWMYLPLFTLAWLVSVAKAPAQKAVVSLLALAYATWTYLSPEQPALSRVGAVALGALVLLWLPRLPIPAIARAPLSIVAAAVFYLYLLHGLFIASVHAALHGGPAAVTLAAAFGGPIAIWWVVEQSGWRQRLLGRLGR